MTLSYPQYHASIKCLSVVYVLHLLGAQVTSYSMMFNMTYRRKNRESIQISTGFKLSRFYMQCLHFKEYFLKQWTVKNDDKIIHGTQKCLLTSSVTIRLKLLQSLNVSLRDATFLKTSITNFFMYTFLHHYIHIWLF